MNFKNSEAMRKNVFILAAAALLSAGCAKEVAEKFEAASYNTTIAAVMESADTKAALADDGKFTWQEGDKIAVYTSANVFKTFTLTDGAGTNKAHFGGDLADGETVTEVAVYPAVLAPKYVSASKIEVTLPESYTYEGPQTNVPMIAALKGNVLEFKQIGGVIKFSFTGIPDGAAKLVTKVDAGITGTFATAPFKTGQNVPIVMNDEVDATSVTINFTKTGDAMDFYVPVPTGEYQGIFVSMQKADGTVITSKTVKAKNVVSRGTLLLMPVVATVTEGNIGTYEQLEAFLASATAETKGEFRLVADIDCSDKTLSQAAGFGGVFDGQGYKIKNLISDKALFATNDGTIKALFIDETCKFSKTVTAATDVRLAPVVVRNNGTLKQIVNAADVTVTGFGSNTMFNMAAGIAAESYGPISQCLNLGAITYDSNGNKCYSAQAAGIVAFLGAAISGCENYGNITLTAPYEANLTNYTTCTPALPLEFYANPAASAAGIVTYAVSSADKKVTVTDCANSGKVSFSMTQIEKGTKKLNRIGIAGIVGNTGGDVTGCTNDGDVVVVFTTSTRDGYNAYNSMIHAAGIAGNDYYVTDLGHGSYADNTIISNCTNTGDVTVDFDSYLSNSAIGGICGWPGVENAQKYNKIENCVNKGDVTVSGSGKSRTGGVCGGATTLYGCINYGTVTNSMSGPNNTDGTVGGVLGYWTYGYEMENCESYGNVVNNGEGNVYVGGLVGSAGAQPGTFGVSCVVSCSVYSKVDRKFTGIVCGRLNDVGQTDPTKYVAHVIGGKQKGKAVMLKDCSVTAGETVTKITNANKDEFSFGSQTWDKAVANEDYRNSKTVSIEMSDGVQFSEHLDAGFFMYDNKEYKVVKLADDRWWMAAPLAYVPAGKTVSSDPAEDAGIWFSEAFDDEGKPVASISDKGYLYDCSTAFGETVTYANYDSFEGVQGICPPGWYIPTRADYLKLVGNSNKSADGPAVDDDTAVYYVKSYKGSNVVTFNKAGWDFSFLGVRTKSNDSATGEYNKNRCGTNNICNAQFTGMPAMNWIMTSTPYQPNAAKTNIQFFSLMTTFTDLYPEGRLMLSYAGYKYGMEVRCVRKTVE